MLCVLFILSLNVQSVFCFSEQIEFYSSGKHYVYCLEPNIKSSKQFDIDFEINKHKRFASKGERQELLSKMLSLGFDKEIAVNYLFPNLNKVVERMENCINLKPQNAKLTVNSNSEKVFHIIKEKSGRIVDKQKLYNLICEQFLNEKLMVFNVPTIEIKPEITQQNYADFIHLRSDFTTNISTSSKDRKHNIKNALNALNKVEILPNQVFSFNQIVGRRTEENGYRNAKIIVNNEFVEGVGGGVCQVSSTLYNSALLAGLEILEANKHSVQVGYVKYGFDAMVNYGSSDLKFRNNTNEKITIITNISDDKIRIRIFGENMGNVSYKLKNEILNVVEPIEEIVIDKNGEYVDKVLFEDESFVLKAANKGMDIKSYREKWIDNKLVETVLLRNDKYKVRNSVRVFGTKKRTEQNPSFLVCNRLKFYGFWLIGRMMST